MRLKNYLSVAAVFVAGGLTQNAWADWKNVPEGWTKVTTLPTEDAELSKYFYVFVDKDNDLMLGLADGQDSKAPRYQTSVNPVTDISKVWMFEHNDDGYSFRNLSYSSLLLQTENNAAYFIHTHDQPNKIDWAKWILGFSVEDNTWTIGNGKYPSEGNPLKNNYVGLWSPQNGYKDGELTAANKHDADVAHFFIYKISKSDFIQQFKDNLSVGDDATAAIINPGFDNAIWDEGWTGTGEDKAKKFINVVRNDFGGRDFAEMWGGLTANNLSQTIQGLPAGTYRLSADMISENGSPLFAKVGDADPVKAFPTVTTKQNVNLQFTLTDGQSVEIGVDVLASTDNRWVAVDNFNLKYIADADNLVSEADAEALLNKIPTTRMNADVAIRLGTAKADFESNKTLVNYETLSPIIDEAIISASSYSALKDALDAANAVKNTNIIDVTSAIGTAFDAAISTAQDIYGSTTTDPTAAQVATLTSVKNDYEAILPHYNVLKRSISVANDVIGETNSGSEEYKALSDSITNANDILKENMSPTEFQKGTEYFLDALYAFVNAATYTGNSIGFNFTNMMADPAITKDQAPDWSNGRTHIQENNTDYIGASTGNYVLDIYNEQRWILQHVKLSAGNYVLKAATRASGNIGSAWIYVKPQNGADYVQGHLNREGSSALKYGFDWTYAYFTVSENDAKGNIEIALYADARRGQWASADNFQLYALGDRTQVIDTNKTVENETVEGKDGHKYLCGEFTAEDIKNAITADTKTIDVRGVKDLTNAEIDIATSANPNVLIYANAGQIANTNNVIVNGTCANLVLGEGGVFAPKAERFTATSAKYTATVSDAGFSTLVLPFAAPVPDAFEAYSLNTVATDGTIDAETVTSIEANKPVLLKKAGTTDFTAENVAISATPGALENGQLVGTYATMQAPMKSYVLQKHDAEVAFYIVNDVLPRVKPFRAYIKEQAGQASAVKINFGGDDTTGINGVNGENGASIVARYNAAGVQVAAPVKGLNIVKMSDGTVKKVIVK